MKLLKIIGYLIIATIASIILVQLAGCASTEKNKASDQSKRQQSAERSFQGSSQLKGDTSLFFRLQDTGTKRTASQYQKETWNIKFQKPSPGVWDSAFIIIGPTAQRWWDSAHAAEITYTRESGTQQTEEKQGKDSTLNKSGTYAAGSDTSGKERIKEKQENNTKSKQVDQKKFATGLLLTIGILALFALIVWALARWLKSQNPLA